jgi:transposase
MERLGHVTSRKKNKRLKSDGLASALALTEGKKKKKLTETQQYMLVHCCKR